MEGAGGGEGDGCVGEGGGGAGDGGGQGEGGGGGGGGDPGAIARRIAQGSHLNADSVLALPVNSLPPQNPNSQQPDMWTA